MHLCNKFNISSNNYSQISDNYFKDKINKSNRTPYYDSMHTPMNISNYKIPHNKKENLLKLKKK